MNTNPPYTVIDSKGDRGITIKQSEHIAAQTQQRRLLVQNEEKSKLRKKCLQNGDNHV